MLSYAWLIPLLPFLAFLAIVFFALKRHRASAAISIAAIFVSLVLAVVVLFEVIGSGVQQHEFSFLWLNVAATDFHMGILLDPLAAVMLIVVTAVAFLVQFYSQGYMKGDPAFPRYYAFMSLFATAMLGLVLAANFLELFIFWELVGLCSYLLIGFWYRKPEAAAAAKKAFIVTRFGDLGLLAGILLIHWKTGTLNFVELNHMVAAGVVGGAVLTTFAILIFCGAIGKSAQFPLHVWLPDAMEGPTPVSALIHAATMVAAGVYLVARSFEIFSAAPHALLVVAYIGAFTAIFAASMGLVMTDIKRVMAYSTISQLGYMMFGLGVGSLSAGMFHLTTHAFFKALLFLGAGSVIHATGTQDMREMGGLHRYMKITSLTILVASLSLSGIFPFAGFWSKDEILSAAWANGYPLIFVIGLVTAFMTAFYVFRMYFMTFTGKHVGVPAPAGHGGHGGGKPHESPWVMTVPLALLAVPALGAGLLGSPWLHNAFGSFLHGGEAEAVSVNWGLIITSNVVALCGVALAYAFYGARVLSPSAVTRRFAPVHSFLVSKYRMDELYGGIVNHVVLGAGNCCAIFDLVVVDGLVNGVGRFVVGSGRPLRRLQMGEVQGYGLFVFGGVVVLAVVSLIFMR